MRSKEVATALLRAFAASRRRLVSDWRIWLMMRRVCHANNTSLPNAKTANQVRQVLCLSGDLATVPGVPHVYQIESPFASLLEVSEEQIIQEANPWAVFSHQTALMYHGLTDVVARDIYATMYRPEESSFRLPLETTRDEWDDGISLPAARRPGKIGGVSVIWSEPGKIGETGIIVGRSFGVPVYMTDPERTLLDAVRMPEKSGGSPRCSRPGVMPRTLISIG